MARREHQAPSVLVRESAAGAEWYIRYRVKVMDIVDGKPTIKRVEKWKALGLCSTMTKHKAERERDKILRDVNQQVYSVQSQIPFTHVLKDFAENHIVTLSAPSQATYRQQIRAYIEPAFKDLRLCDVTTLQIEKLFRVMELDGLARNTRANIKGILKSIFGCCARWHYLEGPSPVKDASIGGGPRAVRECKLPSMEDLGRLIGACPGDVPLLIETLFATGMRISEAAGLMVSDLDFEAGQMSVSRRDCRGDVGDTKSEKGCRKLPIGNVTEALRAHVAGKELSSRVFTWHGEPIRDNVLLGKTITPIMESLGIKFPGFGWHTIRRMHLSLMSKKLSLFDLRHQAGHADIRTTAKYVADDRVARTAAAADLPKIEKPTPRPFIVRKKVG